MTVKRLVYLVYVFWILVVFSTIFQGWSFGCFSRTCEKQISGNSTSQIKQLIHAAWLFWFSSSEQLSWWSSLIRNNKQNEIELHEIEWTGGLHLILGSTHLVLVGWSWDYTIWKDMKGIGHTHMVVLAKYDLCKRCIWLVELKRPNLFCQEALNSNLHLNGILWQQNLKVLF